MTLETINRYCSKLMTACTKVCFFRVACVFTLCIGRDMAVNAPVEAIFFCTNTFNDCFVPVIQDVFKMLPAHDLHGLYTNSVFTVFTFGWRNIFRAARKCPDHGHAGNHDNCKPQKPAIDSAPYQCTSLQFNHSTDDSFRRLQPAPALPLIALFHQVAAQLHCSRVDAG